ncbi:unnamed protein product [Oppiella nova]|uniref:Uncharacterized protein n=1 Tax=Oppiella nova TaxID=334625 RepID=A0A7R9QS03_9ACAR|nr:unnamed protein product [Oppiella nova]CAG2172176.1 unnamed protein product [Oppiella nova]
MKVMSGLVIVMVVVTCLVLESSAQKHQDLIILGSSGWGKKGGWSTPTFIRTGKKSKGTTIVMGGRKKRSIEVEAEDDIPRVYRIIIPQDVQQIEPQI